MASPTAGSVTVSLSQDRGHTWANDVTPATVPGDDAGEAYVVQGKGTYAGKPSDRQPDA